MSNLILVNLYGGPGCGKSTGMAYIFSHLKMAGVNCEMVPEFAKELVWEERFKTLSDQLYVFGKQQKRISMLDGQVDVVVTDSPLLLSLYYGKDCTDSFKELVIQTYLKYDCINILLTRKKSYNSKGRMQTHEEAVCIDDHLEEMLLMNNIRFHYEDGDQDGYDNIVKDTLIKLNNRS